MEVVFQEGRKEDKKIQLEEIRENGKAANDGAHQCHLPFISRRQFILVKVKQATQMVIGFRPQSSNVKTNMY